MTKMGEKIRKNLKDKKLLMALYINPTSPKAMMSALVYGKTTLWLY